MSTIQRANKHLANPLAAEQSRRQIEEAFLQLLSKKPFTAISIFDLCQKASVSRPTFYRSYSSLAALAKTLLFQLHQEFLKTYQTIELGRGQMIYFYTFVQQHPLYELFFANNLGYLFEEVISENFDGFLPKERSALLNDFQRDYLPSFLASTLDSLSKKWIASSYRESPESMAIITEKLLQNYEEFSPEGIYQNRPNGELLKKASKSVGFFAWEYDIVHRQITYDPRDYAAYDLASLGWPPNGVISNVPDSLLKPCLLEDQAMLLDLYGKVNDGINATAEIWTTNPSGPRLFRISYHVVSFANGHPEKALGLLLDVTQEAQREKNERADFTISDFSITPELIAISRSNISDNRLISFRTIHQGAMPFISGMTYDQCIDMMADSAVSPSDKEDIKKIFRRERITKLVEQGERSFRYEYQRCLPQTNPQWVSYQVNAYENPDNHKIECSVYTYDITDKRNNDLILARVVESQFEYIGILHNSTGEFEILRSNLALFPPRTKEPYVSFLTKVRASVLSEDERQNFGRNLALPVVMEHLEKTGKYQKTFSRFYDKKKVSREWDFFYLSKQSSDVLLICSDVTSAVRQEKNQIINIEKARLEAEKANEAKSAFLSSMSHDIRTPLNGVIGFCNFAIQEKDPVKKQDYLEKIKCSSELLLSIVNDTLELSRIESGKYVLQPAAVTSQELFEGVEAVIKPMAEQKHIRLLSDGAMGLKEIYWIDKLKTQRIILNLVSNAIKYTPSGGQVRWVFEKLDNREAPFTRRLVVEDNGIGMSAEFQKQMFEPFTQENRLEAKGTSGTGLGLNIVKRIVTLMGGRISVNSSLGAGTCIRVDLPLKVMDQSAIYQDKSVDYSTLLRGKRVLLCEDNAINQEIAITLLHSVGINVITADNGKEGIEAFQKQPPFSFDAILMDLRMPVCDGFEATKAIRNLERSDAKRVPIIAMSADAFEDDVRRSLNCGMSAHVSKPIDPTTFYATLANAIQKK
jgi:signal transduction histidine kinase/AcrR family transcriptional regulator/ActR/RegA family two-component response regulator